MAEAGERPALVLLGGGGHAKTVTEAAELSGWRIEGHVTPQPGGAGRWLGADDVITDLVAQGFAFALGLGFVNAAGAARRRALLATLGAELPVIAHPAAVVSPSSTLGAGVFVAAGAIIGPAAQIGRGAILNTASVTEHDCRIGANCHLATGARLAGGVSLGQDVLIGAGAVVKQGVSIGDGAVIGAGAVVLRDVDPGAVMVGNPARPVAAGGKV